MYAAGADLVMKSLRFFFALQARPQRLKPGYSAALPQA
jgi:hypothetical protein